MTTNIVKQALIMFSIVNAYGMQEFPAHHQILPPGFLSLIIGLLELVILLGFFKDKNQNRIGC